MKWFKIILIYENEYFEPKLQNKEHWNLCKWCHFNELSFYLPELNCNNWKFCSWKGEKKPHKQKQKQKTIEQNKLPT